MAPRHARRDQWRKTKKGTWTISLGHRGYRVRLFEIRQGGLFYRDVLRPDGVRERKSIGTRDQAEAERRARRLLAALLSGGELAPNDVREPGRSESAVSLGYLCDRFVAECPMFLDNDAHGQADGRTRLTILRAAIGDKRDVRTLTRNDVHQHEARRKRGGIAYGESKVTNAVRQRSVQADIKLLKQVLGWATTVGGPDGSPLLATNPLAGIQVKGEHDVRRPVATHERFEATRAAMQELQRRYAEEATLAQTAGLRALAESRERTWIRAELALVLLEATGRRRGAIMGLRWTDVDFGKNRITWQPESDKKRKTWVVSYPQALFTTVRELQRRVGVVGGYVFPRLNNPNEAAPRELLSQWIRTAEVKAGLPTLKGGTTHPYRRKWRSERSAHPIKAVARAGGWTDIQTMMLYDEPDDADVLAVTSETRKRREVIAAAAVPDG